jgi:hypothetical protein
LVCLILIPVSFIINCCVSVWGWPITERNILKAWCFKYKIAYWNICAFRWLYCIELSTNAWQWVTLSLQYWNRTWVESTESLEILHFSTSQWKFLGSLIKLLQNYITVII